MNDTLDVFRSLSFDGHIYSKILSNRVVREVHYHLYKNDNLLDRKTSFNPDETVTFNVKTQGKFRVIAVIYGVQSNDTHQLKKDIEINDIPLKTRTLTSNINLKKLKNNNHKVLDVPRYSIEVKFDEKGYEQLLEDIQHRLPLFANFSFSHRKDMIITGEVLLPVFSENVLKKYPSGLLDNLYQLPFFTDYAELKPLADELEQLPYVVYCAIVPETLSHDDDNVTGSPAIAFNERSTAKDFTAYQTYLNPFPGMNVRNAWHRGATGKGVTVHVVDSGIYQNHEDLAGNFTLVTNRPETHTRHHGTACAGIIAAKANGFGVTGIAHDCRLFSYESSNSSFDLIIQNAQPGDIVSVSQGYTSSVGGLPQISNQSRWLRLKALTENGVIIFCSAANGGLDISPQSAERSPRNYL
ncbi:S8 family serine peptidase [Erwinia mallotivora]|uniref:S8 family serine peptidase n=1 Tax=Erwinia mallotivora TaxID=69222 RepID=UPI0035EBF217